MAAEYVLQDQATLFAYQSGMSRQGIDLAAGNLSVLALVRDAREAADADLPASADLGPLVATTPVARLLLRRIVLDWAQSIAQPAK